MSTLSKEGSEQSIDNARTKIFYYSAISVILGELFDNFIGEQSILALILGYSVVGVSVLIILFRIKKILNNRWANAIVLYLLIVDVTIATYLTIGKEDFFAHFIRFNILFFAIVPYAGFNIKKSHSIIIGIIFIVNYLVISILTKDKIMIQSIPIVVIITFAFVLGIYLLIQNLFNAYEIKKELLKKAEQSNQALTIRKKELKEVIESKNALFSIISHDLRNPFNTIIGFNDLIDIALQKNDLEKIRKYHPLIKRSTSNAYSLINNLFNWAKSQKENINFSPSRFVYNRVVNNAIALVSNDAKRKNITVRTEIPEEHIIVADMNMVATIVRNLITNAIKFTPKNGEVVIGIKSSDNKILYFVNDSGIGASQEKLEKMFSGQQIESEPGTMNEKGSGLGLNICKGFIEKHQGNIWAEQNDQGGLTVFFTIGV